MTTQPTCAERIAQHRDGRLKDLGALVDLAGVYGANVTNHDGEQLTVDRRYGSWQGDLRLAKGSRSFARVEVLPHVAAALQQRVRRLEKAESRGAAATQEEGRLC